MKTPTNNLIYFCLDYMVLLYFTFILFPWCVSYGLARATGSWLLTPARGEGEDRGWDGWMTSQTRWIWVWASSGRWWWTGKPGLLQSTGSQSWTQLSDWTEWMRLDAMIFTSWMLSLKPAISLSSFIFIKMLFSSSLLSAIRLVSSAYLRFLLFLLALLIPPWASSSLAFLMRYSACKLNKQGYNIQAWHIPFLV